MAQSKKEYDDLQTVNEAVEESNKLADRERRRKEGHASSRPRRVECAMGVNQRMLGRVNACTFYSIGFLQKALMLTNSSEINGEWLLELLQVPGIDIPEGNREHPDAIQVIQRELGGALYPVDTSGTRAMDAVMVSTHLPGTSARSSGVTANALGELICPPLLDVLNSEMQKENIFGGLLLNGTETFAFCKLPQSASNPTACLVLFDPHGDATQTEPAFCNIWENLGAGSLGLADFVDERSSVQVSLIGGTIDLVLLARPSVPRPSPPPPTTTPSTATASPNTNDKKD
ncbi:hypothetical protein Pelo_1082 [Pelomyxa schiedti]|nr:hypothetical protein Pelo_1082 [Pelomyxa schiedti]